AGVRLSPGQGAAADAGGPQHRTQHRLDRCPRAGRALRAEGAGAPPADQPRARGTLSMWVARAEDGFVFGGLTPKCIETLRGVPMLLESRDERVRNRLLPETYDDHASAEQWRRHAEPEL